MCNIRVYVREHLFCYVQSHIKNLIRKDQLITMFILRVVFRALLDYSGHDMICWSHLASVVVGFFPYILTSTNSYTDAVHLFITII